ncbi:hypothetical protein VHEMI05872 [[Torrubiella] hemipterigena]|uniref:RING-type domain-containing protein n=1 Tax=[Torrubiella] hemipterigena TaxID=1531966 RepID=A0A0A1T5H9_9HYPO|nr:hypothetical protein VHEMI05872 [[Torrubiella] hemipterigena]
MLVTAHRTHDPNALDINAPTKPPDAGTIVVAVLVAVALVVFFLGRDFTSAPRSPHSSNPESAAKKYNYKLWKQKENHERNLGDELGIYHCCAICLETLQNTDTIHQLPCKHLFHSECIISWFSRGRDSCPLCVRHYEDLFDSQPEQTFDSGDNIV